jgi:hypothetical protein
MPPASPVFVKRRLTPWKAMKALASVASLISISLPIAMAASAFCTLWLPNIGRRNGPMRFERPVARSVTVTSKVAPFWLVFSFSARTSACGENP